MIFNATQQAPRCYLGFANERTLVLYAIKSSLIVMFLGSMLFASTPSPICHRFLCVDNGANQLLHINQFNPQTNWRISVPEGSRDLQLLDNNRILVSHGDGCGIYSLADGKCLWRLGGFKGIQTARFLSGKNEILLGANVANGCDFYVLSNSGEEFKNSGKSFKTSGIKTGGLRALRFTSNGHLLFSALDPYSIIEWDAIKAQAVWTAHLPGKGYCAVRKEDGTTIATTGGGVSVVTFDKSGAIQRTLLGESFRKELRLNWFSGFDILKNGNIIVANWLGHGWKGPAPHLIEVDQQNRPVWFWEDQTAARQVTGVLVLDDLRQ